MSFPRSLASLLAASLIVLMIGAPAPARAGDGDGAGPFDGDLEPLGAGGAPPGSPFAKKKPESTSNIRLRLGYWFPDFKIKHSLDANSASGTRVNDDILSYDYAFLFPTFEADITFEPYGRIEASFMDLLWEGDNDLFGDVIFGQANFERRNEVESKFEFRTATLYGTMFVDILDGVKGGIVAGVRYIHFSQEIDGGIQEDSDTLDVYIPMLGVSVESTTLIAPFHAFARVLFIDYTADLGGDRDADVSYRAWQLGIGYAVTEYFTVWAEWFDLAADVSQDGSDFRVRFRGPRVNVQISF